MAVLVEVIVDVGVDRGEFLERFGLPETLHNSFSSSKR